MCICLDLYKTLKINGENMNIVLYILIFCMGAVFGSFFTLAVYRIPLGKDITHERSFCPNCNHRLEFLDLIPILSYLFLGAKCRYCKQKIRPRYFLLEIMSGIVFVLFAVSLKLDILNTNINTWIYFIFGILYFASLFIIAGIDKERNYIQKSVLLFGFVVQAIYIIYLYIVEKDFNIYRYVIYLSIICILMLVDIFILRKKIKNSYVIENLLLCVLMIGYTYETITILTIIFTLLCIAIQMLLNKVNKKKNIRRDKTITKIPIGFYLCVTNIVCLITTNFFIL